MNKEREKWIMDRLQKHYDHIESLGYTVVALFLQGSQNYNLDIYTEEYTSDIDSKAIVLPSLDDVVEGKSMVSTKYDFEGEQIDVKDFRVMMDMWFKANPSYLEILHTKFKIINPMFGTFMSEILALKNRITMANPILLIKSIRGMSAEKLAAMEKPYPATMQKIQNFGYDPKQLHHIIRLSRMATDLFYCDAEFGQAMEYREDRIKKHLIDIKTGMISLQDARDMAYYWDNETHKIKEDVLLKYGDNFKPDTQIYDLVKKIVFACVKINIINQIRYPFNANDFKYFSEEDYKAEKKVIESLKVEKKDNFFDYYTEKEN